MLETYLKSSVTRMRLFSGPGADYIDGFAVSLHRQGYTPATIDNLLRCLAGWTDWMLDAGFTAQNLLAGFNACKAALETEHRARYHRGLNRRSVAAAAVFIRFLRQQGVLPGPEKPPSACDRWPKLAEYRSWMRHHRGLTETTLDIYLRTLAALLDALGDNTATYTAGSVRAFVLDRARSHGIERAKAIVVAVRSFLRFLGATGQCPSGLEHAIPGFASWQLASVPRYLASEDVERVIDSCSDDPYALRDRAVLLLLARLGLRAGEVAQLKFTDIDWQDGSISVCGKGRRQELLPLPQEVGNAILSYLRDGRPALNVLGVFVTALAPHRPLTRAAVTHIVRSALRRAGITASINGAHVLRHSVATSMLRQGVTLAGVGAVLRHRSPSTTTRYAKVDFGLLAEIAQPWPGAKSC